MSILTVAMICLNAVARDGALPVKAGFARTDVTPPVGANMPGGFGPNIAKGIHDPLFVEAAWFGNGATELAVVGADLIMMPQDVVDEARRLVETRCGMPGKNILIGASHTHNGGPVVDCFGSDHDPAYCQMAAERIAEAVVNARERALPCRIGAGSGHDSTVGFNRRFRMKDGTVKTHPGKMNPDIVEPEGPVDDEIGVIAVQTMQGQLLGCIVNFALHGTTMGGNKISADWPCYVRQSIRGAVGSDIGVVVINGACGDVTQVDNRSPRPSEFGENWSRRCGMTIGAEALKALTRIDYAEDAPLAVAAETLPLPIRDLAESDEALVKRETPDFGLGGGTQNAVYLDEARRVREMKAKSPTYPVEVQAIRIGNVGIASNPCEYFCKLGLDIKKGSPFPLTMVAELANGYAGYCPIEQAFKGGGYEVRTARSSFLAPGCGEQIAEKSVALLQTLK